VPREDIFLTTKLWNSDQGFEKAITALDASLERLGTDYVDLYLIHWAMPQQGTYLDSWRALIELKKQGKVRSIGVSNFPQAQLREIIADTGVTPAIHQIELHPYFSQEDMRAVHSEFGIVTEAWSPLGQGGEILKDPVIVEIAGKRRGLWRFRSRLLLRALPRTLRPLMSPWMRQTLRRLMGLRGRMVA